MSGALGVVILLACGACGVFDRPATRPRPKPGIEITLYRDHAVVAQRVDVTIPPASTAKVKLRIAAAVDPEDIYLVEKSDLTIKSRAVLGAVADRPTAGCDELACVVDSERECCAQFRKPSEWDDDAPVTRVIDATKTTRTPVDVELEIAAPKEGVFSIVIGYDTPRIDWDASYTVTTTTSHVQAELRGAIAIRNATGIAFSGAKLAVVDAEHGALQARLAKQLEPVEKTDHDSPIAQPRAIPASDLVEGDSRFELIATTLPLRPVLVFDAVGRGLDYQHNQPVQDPTLGVSGPQSTRVVETMAIDRNAALAHLPGGPIHVFERKPDGSLALLSQSTVFGTETLVASIDTIPMGVADKVTGKRERRELTIDNDRKRIVEEFALTIDNARDRPIEILLREHLYRGASWRIAYQSVFDTTKEGQQQIAIRTTVPARSKQTVLYVVVYAWETPPEPKK